MDMNDGMISFHIRVSKKILNPSPESSWQTTKKTNHLRHVYISAVNGALKTFLSRPSSLEPWELGRELRYENKVDGNTRTSFPNPSSRLARWSFGAGFLRESAACAAAADRPSEEFSCPFSARVFWQKTYQLPCQVDLLHCLCS